MWPAKRIREEEYCSERFLLNELTKTNKLLQTVIPNLGQSPNVQLKVQTTLVLPPFSGHYRENFAEWVDKCENLFIIHEIDDPYKKISCLSTAMTGLAHVNIF